MSAQNRGKGANAPPILVVDDDAGQRSLFESFLSGQGFHVVAAASGEEALALLDSQEFRIMISDVRMPGISGLEALRRARQKHPNLSVLLVTAYADVKDAVGAMRDGAVNYLEKPIDLDELLASVRHAAGLDADVSARVIEDLRLPEGVIAESAATRAFLREAALAAPSQARILICGESGVGKEVVADLIHAWSPRASGPLVKVNCAALPETLLESELFGHEKGAFTGADARRVGRFEEANGGTILLDEIAEMSPALQAKLLRVTQNGTFQRVGSNEERRTDARILASTNRDLEAEVKAGRFREDLFFRLNVMEIFVPPLRERRADVLPLARFFASKFSGGNPRFSTSVVASLELYDWPGNVRELANAMERAALMARGEVILPEHLPKRVQAAGAQTAEGETSPSSGKRMEEVERAVILQTLRENNYNRTETARVLGISRRALIYKLRRFAEEGHAVDP
ncbi:MAG TPA: sigma-54 dependent transcriptional regulator [Sumerlaeia bacterium]|nr:sigma-54 dependent transcriptional regulator [Sumerlaeia bacterium]